MKLAIMDFVCNAESESLKKRLMSMGLTGVVTIDMGKNGKIKVLDTNNRPIEIAVEGGN